MEQAQNHQLSVEQQLEEIRIILKRICAENDMIVNALTALLQAQGLIKTATSLVEQLEELHQERREQDNDRVTPVDPLE